MEYFKKKNPNSFTYHGNDQYKGNGNDTHREFSGKKFKVFVEEENLCFYLLKRNQIYIGDSIRVE